MLAFEMDDRTPLIVSASRQRQAVVLLAVMGRRVAMHLNEEIQKGRFCFMMTIPDIPGEDKPGGKPELRKWSPPWRWVFLASVVLVSIFLNFFQLGQDGFANLYYAAAIRSMLDSWHTFFFVSFDPGGFVSVDKPPLGLWLQVASAKMFGFSPFSMFLPQALAGVAAVLVLYILVRRHSGSTAGLIAAFALAISPISVVTNRNNTIDSTLVLVLLLGAWAVMRAAETGKLRWLLLCAVSVGLGFNIKMMQAYLVIPAYGLLYLLASPRKIWVRVRHLALATLLLLTISLSWVVTVDLTPASQRPYVGSSQDNSELSLTLGYNGMQRLLGAIGIGGGDGAGNGGQRPQAESGGGDTVGMFHTGNPGVFRLFNEPLGGQIVWVLPLALLAILALAWQRRPAFHEDREQQSLLLWGIWLLTMTMFFSAASFFHQYYLSMLAPAVCALFGIGVVVMWRAYQRADWRGWLLPLALPLTALEQIHIITSDPSWGAWLIPLIAVPCVLGAMVLVVARLVRRLRQRLDRRVLISALGLALAGLLILSAAWSAYPSLSNTASDLPTAGLSQPNQGSAAHPPAGESLAREGNGVSGGNGPATEETGQQAPAAGGNGVFVDSALIGYLEANRDGAKYLLAVPSAGEADSIILVTNQPVMALGGYTGSDPILTTSQLAALVANGTVRYFLLGGGGEDDQDSLTSWVAQNCTAVPSSALESNSPGDSSGTTDLFVCQATT